MSLVRACSSSETSGSCRWVERACSSTLQALRSDTPKADGRVGHTSGDGRGSEVSLRGLLEYLVVQGQFGHRPFESVVLGLQLLQAPRLVHPETPEFGPPVVEGLLGDTDATDTSTKVLPEAMIASASLSLLMISSAVCPLGYVSSPGLTRILKSILDRFPGAGHIVSQFQLAFT